MFGWCAAGQHLQCTVSYRPWWFETQRKKQVMVYADSKKECGCKCHKRAKKS